jgi:ATP-dependent Lon protease
MDNQSYRHDNEGSSSECHPVSSPQSDNVDTCDNPGVSEVAELLSGDYSEGGAGLEDAVRFATDLVGELARNRVSPDAMKRAAAIASRMAHRKMNGREMVLDALYDTILDDPEMTESQRDEIRRVKTQIKDRKPCLRRIADLRIETRQKRELIDLYVHMLSLQKYSPEYNMVCEELNRKIAAYENPHLVKMTPDEILKSNLTHEEKIQRLNSVDMHQSELDVLQRRILDSQLPDRIRILLLTEMRTMKLGNTSEKDYTTTVKWIENTLRLPTCEAPLPIGKDANIDTKACFEQKVLEKFDTLCYGMKHVKERVVDYLFCKIHSENAVMPVLLLVGEPGTGKTNVAQCIASILHRPLIRVKFGGQGDSVKLVGGARQWVGSAPGEIMRGLQEARVTNPVILLDEIDKIGRRDGDGNQQDISSTLLHIVDTYKNNFTDEYFGFEWDLSRVFWVATANDEGYIDPILVDRCTKIHIGSYTIKDKMEICKKFFIPACTERMGLAENSVTVPNETIQHVIEYVSGPGGMRDVKKAFEDMFARIVRMVSTGRIALPFIMTSQWFDQQAELLGMKKRQPLPYII